MKPIVVRVYRNLHTGNWSVQTYRTEKNGWRVWKHVNTITLFAAVFKVSEAGRQRVIREGKKHVHAIVEGVVVKRAHGGYGRVSYNPYKAGVFVTEHGPIHTAKFVRFDGQGAWFSDCATVL